MTYFTYLEVITIVHHIVDHHFSQVIGIAGFKSVNLALHEKSLEYVVQSGIGLWVNKYFFIITILCYKDIPKSNDVEH